MKSYLYSAHYDLTTPDGQIESIKLLDEKSAEVTVSIKNISPFFAGYKIEKKHVFFNLKSTLAQIGFTSETLDFTLFPKKESAEVALKLQTYSKIAEELLKLLEKGALIGKLFAADETRKVRDPYYLMRMFGRCDKKGQPLLALGGPNGRDDLILEKVEGYTIAFLPLKKGVVKYDKAIFSFLPALAKMLLSSKYQTREMLPIYQTWDENLLPQTQKNEILLVKTEPLHIRTVFAKVADKMLPAGYKHTSANVLSPTTTASGNIYELFGESGEILETMPLEFYTLEPHREHVFFEDRDQLQNELENPEALFKAFKTDPEPQDLLTATYVVKGTQLETLAKEDWIAKEVYKQAFPGLTQPTRQAFLVDKYIEQQPIYPILKAMENDIITSQGILLCRYFPSPVMKRLLLSPSVQRCLKAIYFNFPSRSSDIYFSHEDRAFLLDLAKFALPVFWVDEGSHHLLKYVVKAEKDAGMFVPVNLVEAFMKATFFGIYGSNLLAGSFGEELKKLLFGVLKLKEKMTHPLLNPDTPIALVTGGGPGAMEVGNQVAKELNLLSCANIVDFRSKDGSVVREQFANPYIDAKMTYRLDHLIERQAEFHLDIPICLPGGYGTDFEYSLEEVRRKVGSTAANPILLFGPAEYWKQKVTSRFQCNLKEGTIKGSEWVSNCFYSIQKAEEGISVLEKFFSGKLPIGKNGPVYQDGFCIVSNQKP
ncbi:MAG: hypothetical protein WC371_01255 [Parachlamydiales bacterium]|jgi:hypothetical protein